MQPFDFISEVNRRRFGFSANDNQTAALLCEFRNVLGQLQTTAFLVQVVRLRFGFEAIVLD